MAISNATILSRNDELVHSAIDDETVMMSIEQGEYYGLDATGTRIWNMLEEPLSNQQICDRLEADYAVDRAQLEQDVLVFLQKMIEEKILYTDQ